METMTEYVKNRVQEKRYGVAIDFTMGNGNDTKMLSTVANEVYSFDIQEQALINTRKLLGDNEHIRLIKDSHEYFDKYIKNFDVGIFNLGYLPNGNHEITTTVATTLVAIDKAVTYLNKKGHLFIVVYIGHVQGKEESLMIDEYVSNLNHIDYNVALFKMMNKVNAPYVIEIEKR